MQDHKKRAQSNNSVLPPIPDKLYFTIGQVSTLCSLKAHVLRYWEQEFPQLSPSKRRGNRRYYQRKEVILIRQIRDLLYNQGFTIEGARSQLTNQGGNSGQSERLVQFIRTTLNDLEEVLSGLES